MVGSYDVENRLITQGQDRFAYGGDNKRVWKLTGYWALYQNSGTYNGTDEVYFYGVDGKKLGTYRTYWDGVQLSHSVLSTNVYFGGKLIQSGGKTVVLDRLGSVRATSTGEQLRYYPYGEDRPGNPSNPTGREKFATYYRDPSGLDYADQRYYASNTGRFLTPDPYRASGGPADPGSWNRYAYVQGDPVNFHDPRGLLAIWPHDDPGGGRRWFSRWRDDRARSFLSTFRSRTAPNTGTGIANRWRWRCS